LADIFESELSTKNSELMFQLFQNEEFFGDRIIFTSHSASHTIETRNEMRKKEAISIKTFIQERKMKNFVNYHILH